MQINGRSHENRAMLGRDELGRAEDAKEKLLNEHVTATFFYHVIAGICRPPVCVSISEPN
jgi:hypothetical protein